MSSDSKLLLELPSWISHWLELIWNNLELLRDVICSDVGHLQMLLTVEVEISIAMDTNQVFFEVILVESINFLLVNSHGKLIKFWHLMNLVVLVTIEISRDSLHCPVLLAGHLEGLGEAIAKALLHSSSINGRP